MAATIIAETYYAQAGDDVEAALIQAFTSANSAILDFSREKNAKIGTTCTVLSVRDGRATVGHVGDSRAYIVDAEGIRQLTIDHSLAASLHRDGIITIEQARTHPGRSALTRALGVREDCEPDVVIVGDVHPEDVFVLCTDGLARIPDREIEQTVRSTGPQAATEMLVAEANNRGGADNATAVVVGFREAVDR
jgi:protein phosphatase